MNYKNLTYDELYKLYLNTFDLMIYFQELGFWKDAKAYQKRLNKIDQEFNRREKWKKN